MYTPEAFAQRDPEAIDALVDAHSFATLITPVGSDAPAVTHLPLALEGPSEAPARCVPGGRLVGHLARANPHWKQFEQARSLAIFHGPHHYVSPAWYETDPAVPTWNYVAVHVHGRARAVEDEETAFRIVDELVRSEEARRDPSRRWSGDLPAEFRRKLQRAIVVFELEIEEVEAKFKLGQNRSAADQAGVLAGLEGEGSDAARAFARFVRDVQGPVDS